MNTCESTYEGYRCWCEAGHAGLCWAPGKGGLGQQWNRGIGQTIPAGHRGPLAPLADECYPADAVPLEGSKP